MDSNHCTEISYHSDSDSDSYLSDTSFSPISDEENDIFILQDIEIVKPIIFEPQYDDYLKKEDMLKELKARGYYPDFKTQIAFLDVVESIRNFDKTTLKDVKRTHWIRWFKSFLW